MNKKRINNIKKDNNPQHKLSQNIEIIESIKEEPSTKTESNFPIFLILLALMFLLLGAENY